MHRYHLALGMAALFVVCATAHAELGEGSSGPEVRALQRALNLYGSRLEVAGVFEKDTVRAVRRYQRLHELEVTGVADDATLEQLMQPLKLGDTGSQVRRLQRLLEAPVTGAFRSSTVDAVKRFQREHELEPTGEFALRLLGLFDDDPEATLPPELDSTKEEGGATRTPGSAGAGTAGSDSGSGSDSGAEGSSKSKLGDELEDLFTGMAKTGRGGGGQFANGQGPNAAGGGQSAGGGGSSGRALGGSVSPREDPLAHLRQRSGSSGSSQSGQGSQAGQGSQSGQGSQGGQASQSGQGSQAGQASQSGQASQGGQGTQSGQGSQSKGEQGKEQGADDLFTSEKLPFKDFTSLSELASALEVLKLIERIQQALAQGTVEEPLVQAMRGMQGKLASTDAKALVDLAIKVYEIPGPDGKNVYVQPALVAVLKAKAVEIGAVPQGPGSAASAPANAAYDQQVAARFPGLR